MIDSRTKKELRNYLKKLMAQEKNRIKIISVYPLSKEEMTAVAKKFLKSPTEIENIVDPSIVGGIIIQQGSNVLDLSIKNQLQNIEKNYGNY
jgi:ATP synthase F1 delta subunit